MTRADRPRTRVLYVGGTGRSGSTTLANVLGEATGLVSVGEVRFLWERGILQDRLCGCGVPFSACTFWSEVLDEALGPGTQEERAELATRMVRALRERTRMRTLPRQLAAGRRRQSPAAEADVVGVILERVYAAIVSVAHASVVVDASKLPTYAGLLAETDGIELQVAHLVRDPRAAAYSWRRHKRQPDLGETAMMERRGSGKSALLWSVWNRSLESMCRTRGVDYTRLGYEQFVAEPRRQVQDLLGSFGLPPEAVEGVFMDDHTVFLSASHTVAGNPSRHHQGAVPLVVDDEWRQRMRGTDRGAVAVLTWPTLQRYGYRIRG